MRSVIHLESNPKEKHCYRVCKRILRNAAAFISAAGVVAAAGVAVGRWLCMRLWSAEHCQVVQPDNIVVFTFVQPIRVALFGSIRTQKRSNVHGNVLHHVNLEACRSWYVVCLDQLVPLKCDDTGDID